MPDLTAPAWVKEAVFYQIFPDRFANGDPSNDPPGTVPWESEPNRENFFGGDLKGIRNHLPYLEDLGITAIYLTPIFKARSNHKYDTSDYFQIDPAFGDLESLHALVLSAHERGIRVVLDAVFNHCGDSFWAFEDLLENGANSPYRDWFYPTDYPIVQAPPNYQTCGGAHFLPKLNVANPQVREHLLKAAVFWLKEAEIDGWRLDVPWKVPMDFWRAFRQAVKATNPEAYIVAETWRDTPHWLAGDTCDGVMNYPLRDYLLDYCVRDAMDAEDVDYFIRRLTSQQGPAAPYQLNLLGSHDTARLLTSCKGDPERAILAVSMQFTLTGVPMIYYGDEVGMEGGNDPDCRRPMIWNSQAWNEKIQRAYRLLIQARVEHPALRNGDFHTLLTFNGVYSYQRGYEDDRVIVVVNPRERRQFLRIPLDIGRNSASAWRDVFTGKIYERDDAALILHELPSRRSLVLYPVQGK